MDCHQGAIILTIMLHCLVATGQLEITAEAPEAMDLITTLESEVIKHHHRHHTDKIALWDLVDLTGTKEVNLEMLHPETLALIVIPESGARHRDLMDKTV